MTFRDTPEGRSGDVAAAAELAAIVRNANRLGIPAWRVATALEVPAQQLAQVQALVGGGLPLAGHDES